MNLEVGKIGKDTSIAWTDATLNFGWGCRKVDSACQNCYMFRLNKTWGIDPTKVRLFDIAKREKELNSWTPEKRLIFVNDMTDTFGELYSFELIAEWNRLFERHPGREPALELRLPASYRDVMPCFPTRLLSRRDLYSLPLDCEGDKLWIGDPSSGPAGRKFLGIGRKCNGNFDYDAMKASTTIQSLAMAKACSTHFLICGGISLTSLRLFAKCNPISGFPMLLLVLFRTRLTSLPAKSSSFLSTVNSSDVQSDPSAFFQC